MIIYYALFVNSIIALGVQMKIHVTHKDDVRVKKYNKIQLYLIPVIVIVGIVIIWNA